ncbi:hypothetical protein GQ42DRAFT_76876 [Ramicandelaber brevisporus]|nr:hypothetical protein GQ42DRAFT_76876 [Ramicandelaber brevisporus]
MIKVKSFFSGKSPSSTVDAAVGDLNKLDALVSLVTSSPVAAQDVAKQIRKRLKGSDVVELLSTLAVLQALMERGGSAFHLQLVDKRFLHELELFVAISQKTAPMVVRDTFLDMLGMWSIAFSDFPALCDISGILKHLAEVYHLRPKSKILPGPVSMEAGDISVKDCRVVSGYSYRTPVEIAVQSPHRHGIGRPSIHRGLGTPGDANPTNDVVFELAARGKNIGQLLIDTVAGADATEDIRTNPLIAEFRSSTAETLTEVRRMMRAVVMTRADCIDALLAANDKLNEAIAVYDSTIESFLVISASRESEVQARIDDFVSNGGGADEGARVGEAKLLTATAAAALEQDDAVRAQQQQLLEQIGQPYTGDLGLELSQNAPTANQNLSKGDFIGEHEELPSARRLGKLPAAPHEHSANYSSISAAVANRQQGYAPGTYSDPFADEFEEDEFDRFPPTTAATTTTTTTTTAAPATATTTAGVPLPHGYSQPTGEKKLVVV